MTSKKFLDYGILLCVLTVFSCIHMKKIATITSSTGQMILVLTDSVTATYGNLYCYERSDANADWKLSGKIIPVSIGRNGLGLGIGLHQQSSISDLPKKEEGDGRSPAGIFRLSKVFGYATADKTTNLKMPYIHITEMIECVDDVKSKYYNQIVSREKIEKPDTVDWQSSEKMNSVGARYDLGAVIDHNSSPVKTGCGSCIFLHNWTDPIITTSGCTSMAPINMKRIAFWLDKQKNPVIVQLTKQLYSDLKRQWGLPEINK